jgi:hypothetical protein
VTYFNRDYKEVIGLFLILSHKVEMKSVNLAISFIKFEALQWSWKDLVSESSLYRCKVFHNRNKKNIMLLLILVIFTRQEVAKINITLFNREYIST